jgi:hypothetical protein
MESPSFSSPLIHEKTKKNRNLLKYMCVCEYINSFKKYSMKIIKCQEKDYLKITNDKKVNLISINIKPNVPLIYLKHILGKNLD